MPLQFPINAVYSPRPRGLMSLILVAGLAASLAAPCLAQPEPLVDPEIIREGVDDRRDELDDMELVLLHQANLRLVHRILDRIGVPQTSTMTNVEKYGNTSGAGLPLVLWEAQNSGRLSRGDLVLTVAFGTGMSYGAALIRWCDPSDFAA